MEGLEERHMLSITVNTLTDEIGTYFEGGNSNSLREALAYAATQNGPDVIEFDAKLSGGTIQLTHGQLIIDSYVTIAGLGADALTIRADSNSRAVLVNGNVNATINGLSITGGTSNYGGGVFTFGNLVMNSVRVEGNSATSDGGGIYVEGSLELNSSTVLGNDAAFSGGGICLNSTGLAIINNSAIDGNSALYGGGI